MTGPKPTLAIEWVMPRHCGAMPGFLTRPSDPETGKLIWTFTDLVVHVDAHAGPITAVAQVLADEDGNPVFFEEDASRVTNQTVEVEFVVTEMTIKDAA